MSVSKGGSLFNLSKAINADPTIKEAADAEKEYETLVESRKRVSIASPTDHNAINDSSQSKLRKKRRPLSKQEAMDPKSSKRASVPSRQPPTKQKPPQIFRTICQYKKPSTLLRAPDFKSRFIVIDSHFKFMRIYRNEKELKNREPFKYELPLKHSKTAIKNIQKKRNCLILTINKQEHTFYFNTKDVRHSVLDIITLCNASFDESKEPQTTRRATAGNVSQMVDEYEHQQSLGHSTTVPSELNADMLLELYAETDKGREVARWLNQNKTSLSVQQLQNLSNILRNKQKDHTFIQNFAAGQGLTYLCSISILRQHEWDILVVILDIFEIILNTRDLDHHKLIGYDLIREHSHAIQAIVDMFECTHKTVKCKVIKLGTVMCMYDDAGLEAVLKALYTYGERHNATSVFDEFVRSMYFEQDLEFRRDALKFVNAVLNLSPDLKRRIDSRHMLSELGFDNVLDQLWDVIASEHIAENDDGDSDDVDKEEDEATAKSTTQLLGDVKEGKKSKQKMRYDESMTVTHPLLREIKEQLIVYRKLKEDDEKEVFWDGVNLNDPQEIVKHLFKKAVQQKHLSDFMKTLISMCTIPDNSSALWGALPKLILNATGQTLKFDVDGDQIQLKNKPQFEDNEDDVHDEDEDYVKIFDDIDVLKDRLNQGIQQEIKEEQDQFDKEIKKLNKEKGRFAHENMKLENESIKAKAKAASQQFLIDEFTKDMKKIKKQLKKTQNQLEDTRIQLESRPSPSLKARSPLLSAQVPPKLTPIAAPIPTPQIPAPLPTDPDAAPLPAPLPGVSMPPGAPMPAPLPGSAPMPAPLPGVSIPAPLPTTGSAPIAAPLPGAIMPAPAPLPGCPAPLPGSAPMTVPIPCIASAAPLPGSAAPIPGAPPLPLAAPPPIPGLLPPLPGTVATGGGPPPPIIKKKPKHDPVPKPRKKMVPFHWKPIKKLKANQKSIWTEIALDKIKIDIELNETSKQPKDNDDDDDKKEDKERKTKTKDKSDDNIEHLNLNIDELEKLFAKPPKKSKKKRSNKGQSSKPKKPKREIISLLDDKRSYNMCIALSRLKMQNDIIRDSILSLNEKHLDLDKIQKLMPIVPNAQEQQTFQNFDGEPDNLDVPDKFCYALRNIENLHQRLKFWQFKIEFEELCGDEKERVNLYNTAYNNMINNTSFEKTLQYILLVGNYMNSGTKKGGVIGFNVESLLALANNKSADKTESLLSFIVKQIRKHNPSALDFTSVFIKVLPPAIKLDPELIKSGIDDIGKTLSSLYGKIKESTEDKKIASEYVMIDVLNEEKEEKKEDVIEDMFDTKMSTFCKVAQKQHKEVETEFKESQKRLLEFGGYLGQKNDVEFEYMKHLLGFAQNVNKVIDAIKRAEREEQQRLKREETKKRKREQKKLREQRRKEEKEKEKEKRPKERRKGKEKVSSVPVPASVSLENKLNDLFSGSLSLHDLGATKKQKKKRPAITVEEKMYDKMESQQANFAEDMLMLLSIDNIQKRRKSRFFGEKDIRKDIQREKSSKKQSKASKLLDISEFGNEPMFERQSTALLIKKDKNKLKKKRKKRKRSKFGKLLGI